MNEALQEKLRDILHECYAEYGGKSWKDAREKTVGNRALNHYMHEMRLSYVITRVGNLWFLEKEGVELLETDDE